MIDRQTTAFHRLNRDMLFGGLTWEEYLGHGSQRCIYVMVREYLHEIGHRLLWGVDKST